MLTRLTRSAFLVKDVSVRCRSIYVPHIKSIQIPDDFPKDIDYPERRKLKVMDKVPPVNAPFRSVKQPKRLSDIRGPEEVLTTLLHKQFGIRALGGGYMKYEHFEVLRLSLNKKLDENKQFAIWRLDAPWKPITSKGQGHRMGGGKGSIHHYVTPVKCNRILLELGGKIDWSEAHVMLRIVAERMPFKCDVVSHEILERERLDKERKLTENLNPFSFKYCVKNNINGCRSWMSPVDEQWYGEYR